MPYNILIIIYFRRDARCSAKSHAGAGAPAAARAHGGEQQGELRQCAGRGGQHGPTQQKAAVLCTEGAARRGRAGVSWPASSLLSNWYFPARRNAAPAAAARQPTGASTRRTPTRCAAGSRTGTPFCWPGPGWESAADVCKALLGRNAPWAGAVLDADALNALAAGRLQGGSARKHDLTPHPGEARAAAGPDCARVQADREGAAVSLAEKISLRRRFEGHHTLVAAPDGTVWRNETCRVSQDDSGDILAGLTAGLLAAGLKQGPHARGRRGLRGMAPRCRCRPLRQTPQHDRHAAGGSV